MARISQSWRHFKGGTTPVRVVHNSLSLDVDARKEAAAITLDLPMPTSVNALYNWGAGCKSDKYEGWIKEAGWELLAQKPGRIVGKYSMKILVSRPTRAGRFDLGNREKALSDLLVKHRVLSDDSLAEKITLEWCNALAAGRVRVTVTEARA